MSKDVECIKSDPVYIDRVVNNLKESARKIASRSQDFPEISMAHSEYIHEIYLDQRIIIENSFPSYIDAFYPENTNPYFIWKDSNARLAWEYLRKFYEYQTQWEWLGRDLSGWENFLSTEPINPVPDDIIDVFRFGSTFERYQALNYLRKIAWHEKLVGVSKRNNVHPYEASVRDTEQKIRKMFGISDEIIPHFSERRHPVFCGSAKSPDIIFKKKHLEVPDILLDEFDMRALEDGIAVFIRKDEILSTQIKLLIKKLPGYFQNISDKRNGNYRFRDDLHATYIMILNNLPASHELNRDMARMIYPNIDPTSAFKRLEKAARAAVDIMEVYYVDLAYQQFRPSTLRRYRQ